MPMEQGRPTTNDSRSPSALWRRMVLPSPRAIALEIEGTRLMEIATAKAVGTLIGNIPGIKEGPVDEFLVDQGSRMKKSAYSMQAQFIKEFAEISNPQTGVFVDRLEDVIRIFNHTDQICFDRENIYLM